MDITRGLLSSQNTESNKFADIIESSTSYVRGNSSRENISNVKTERVYLLPNNKNKLDSGRIKHDSDARSNGGRLDRKKCCRKENAVRMRFVVEINKKLYFVFPIIYLQMK